MYELRRVLITSSRDASNRLRQFLNELEVAIPGAIKVNRGRSSILNIATKAAMMGIRKILYVGSKGGNPGFIKFIDVDVERSEIDVLPYSIRIHGVKLLIDMPVKVNIRSKPRTAVIASLNSHAELLDVLGEQLGMPSIIIDDLESVRGMYDVVIMIRRIEGMFELGFIDGVTMGPRGPTMWISDVIYAKPRVIRIG